MNSFRQEKPHSRRKLRFLLLSNAHCFEYELAQVQQHQNQNSAAY